MQTVRVKASREYDICIGIGLLDAAGALTAAVKGPCAVMLVSDSTVAPLYADRAAASYAAAGFAVHRFTFPAGEQSKNMAVLTQLLEALGSAGFTRGDLLAALGGGVTGDLTGFAAAVYQRGVDYVQLPTTLLAAVDSSVGGKTGINLPAGKNLAGAFCQPRLVLCDYDLMATLTPEIFGDGCAEVIKYSILGSVPLYDHLLEKGRAFDTERVIAECVAMKGEIVHADEFDTGTRQLLNLGHTIGHGVEACSRFEISHGQAVAIGMAIIARAARAKGYCDDDCVEGIVRLLAQFDLPTTTTYSTAELLQWSLSDKKRAGGTITLVVPREIGRCELVKIPVTELESWIEAGRTA